MDASVTAGPACRQLDAYTLHFPSASEVRGLFG
jgi:hypothetical protein